MKKISVSILIVLTVVTGASLLFESTRADSLQETGSVSDSSLSGCFHVGRVPKQDLSSMSAASVDVSGSVPPDSTSDDFRASVATAPSDGKIIAFIANRAQGRVTVNKSFLLKGPLSPSETGRMVCFNLRKDQAAGFCAGGGIRMEISESRWVIPVGQAEPVEDRQTMVSFPCNKLLDEAFPG